MWYTLKRHILVYLGQFEDKIPLKTGSQFKTLGM